MPTGPDDSSESAAPGGPDWRHVGLRRTPQREIVLRLVRSCYQHPTAEWIHQEARRHLPEISLATVYRTLRLLKEKGLIHEFSGGASPSRYDGTLHDPHEHVRCVRCGEVADVELPEAAAIRRMVAGRTGFHIERYPLLFHGLCGRCCERTGTSGGKRNENPEDLDRSWVEGLW
jgi:Fur family ferric uptake transcriptional regulator/Fur family peroxide stress response transcriptional regulator